MININVSYTPRLSKLIEERARVRELKPGVPIMLETPEKGLLLCWPTGFRHYKLEEEDRILFNIYASQTERVRFDFLYNLANVVDYGPFIKLDRLTPLLRRPIEGAKKDNKETFGLAPRRHVPTIHIHRKPIKFLFEETIEILSGRQAIYQDIYSRLSR